MSKICIVYKITSPSGKIYIGESYNLKARIKKYEKNNCKKQPRLFASLNKYGWEAHEFEIVEECEISEIYCRERFWQDFYDVIGKNGLNCRLTECSEENIKRENSEETRLKRSLAQRGVKNNRYGKVWELSSFYGKKHTEEAKQIISEKAIERFKTRDGFWLNKSLPEEVKLKISQKRKENECSLLGNNPNSKIVLDLNSGIFYECLKEACIALNLNYKRTQPAVKGSRNRKNKTSLRYV